MGVEPEALRGELRQLRQRQGTYHPAMRERFGPQLRIVCGIADPDAPPKLLRAELKRCIRELFPDDARTQTVLMVALGLDDRATFDTLDERIEWLGRNVLSLEKRSVREYVDEAIERFVQAAVAEERRIAEAGAEAGHTVDAFAGHLSLIGDRAVVTEVRKIKAARDELDVIPCRFGLAGIPPGGESGPFDIEVLDGGELAYLKREGNVIRYGVRPSHPLMKGQVHEFRVRFVLPPGQPTEPHYVVQSITRFESVSISVQFDLSRPPARLWRVYETTHRGIDYCPPDEKRLSLDLHGEATVAFQGARAGLSYGMAWEPAAAPEARRR